jgi:hypothetical protein
MKIIGIRKALIIGLVLVGSISFLSDVRAGLTPSLQAGSPTGIGPFTFTYDVELASDQKLNAGGAPPASVILNPGTLGSSFTSFFTVYDFGGLVAGSNTQPAGWGFQSLLVGSTPSSTSPVDQVAVSNLTWFWTGVDAGGNPVPTPGAGLLGDFTADSTIGNLAVLHNFTSGATKNTPSDPNTNNTAIGTIGTVVAPGPSAPPPPPGQVPEPATLLLLGTGLAGLAGWRKWSAKKS